MAFKQKTTGPQLPEPVKSPDLSLKVRVISASALHLTLEYLNPNDAAKFAYLAGACGQVTFRKEEA